MTVEQVPGETGQMTSPWGPAHETIPDSRRMAPSEKYELFLSVLTGQTTQQEPASGGALTGPQWLPSA